MKKIQQFPAVILMIAAFLITVSARATLWRVNNTAGASANFTTAQAAHDGAQPGDSIYFEPSTVSYGDLVCSKKVILIGTGYFLTENPETQALPNPSTLGNVNFAVGSAYSQMMGLTMNTLYLRDSWLIISRNRINGGIQIRTGESSPPSSLHDIVIQDNYLGTWSISEYNSGNGGNVTNLLITNNMINAGIYLDATSVSIIQNNIVTYHIDVYNSQVINNIMPDNTVFSPRNNTYTNNIGSNTQFGNQNGNQQNVSMSTVFVCWYDCSGYSTDGRWQLKAGSPAIGVGAGGVDCGIFGGATPYVLSGLPNIPAIYSYTLYNNSNVLNVNLKVKSHN
jgi:hypothetical protein